MDPILFNNNEKIKNVKATSYRNYGTISGSAQIEILNETQMQRDEV